MNVSFDIATHVPSEEYAAWLTKNNKSRLVKVRLPHYTWKYAFEKYAAQRGFLVTWRQHYDILVYHPAIRYAIHGNKVLSVPLPVNDSVTCPNGKVPTEVLMSLSLSCMAGTQFNQKQQEYE